MFDEEFLRKLELLRLAVRKLATVPREGNRSSRRRGPSPDFLSHLPYAPGEDIRYVDWAAYARLEEIFVKQFAREENISLDLVVDGSASMRFADKLGLARRLAQAFGYVVLAGRGRVRTHFPDAPGVPSRSFDGPSAILPFLRHLQTPVECPPLSIAAVHRSLGQAARPSVVILTDLWFGLEREDLETFRARISQAAFVQILAPEEMEPDFHGKLRIVDSESGASRDMYVDDETLREYREKLQEKLDRIAQLLQDREFLYARLRSDVPIETAFFVTIRQAGLIA